MKVSFPNRRCAAAYTLVEIMLVLSIIAVLVGAVIYKLAGNVEAAQMQRADNDMEAIATQLKTYRMMNNTFPTTSQGLQALVTRPTSEPQPKRWTQFLKNSEAINDPWGHPFQYAFPGKKNPQGFDLFSTGPDGQLNTADDMDYGS